MAWLQTRWGWTLRIAIAIPLIAWLLSNNTMPGRRFKRELDESWVRAGNLALVDAAEPLTADENALMRAALEARFRPAAEGVAARAHFLYRPGVPWQWDPAAPWWPTLKHFVRKESVRGLPLEQLELRWAPREEGSHPSVIAWVLAADPEELWGPSGDAAYDEGECTIFVKSLETDSAELVLSMRLPVFYMHATRTASGWDVRVTAHGIH